MTSACQSEDSKDLTAEFVAGLLTKYSLDLYKAQFQQPQYSKNNLPKDFDHLIAPFKISKEAKRIRCGLLLFLFIMIHIYLYVMHNLILLMYFRSSGNCTSI